MVIEETNNWIYFGEIMKDIEKLIGKERMERVLVLDSIDSTNNLLKKMASRGAPDGQVVIADEQTGGRGRLGRSFFSPKGKGIYLSYLIKPDTAPSDAVSLTAWTASAMARAVESACGTAPGIKWVNDLYMNGKKICGILTEMTTTGQMDKIDSIIIGIGFNVNNDPSDFPDEISGIASSIAIETGRQISRSGLAACMIRELDRMTEAWPKNKDEYLRIYKSLDITSGHEVNVSSGGSIRPALVLGINDDFSLKVKFSDGEISDLSSGEISLKLL